MKVIDIIKDLADGKEVKPFRIGNLEFRVINKQIRKKVNDYYSNVEWLIYEEWLNEEIEIIEDEFIDIREVEIPEIDKLENERICRAEYKINDLIKNQKKIIERLNK